MEDLVLERETLCFMVRILFEKVKMLNTHEDFYIHDNYISSFVREGAKQKKGKPRPSSV